MKTAVSSYYTNGLEVIDIHVALITDHNAKTDRITKVSPQMASSDRLFYVHGGHHCIWCPLRGNPLRGTGTHPQGRKRRNNVA